MGYRRFKPELKRRGVEEWVSGAKRIAEVCRKYKLGDSLVGRWRHDHERKGPGAWETASESNGELATAHELRRPQSDLPTQLFTEFRYQA